VNLWDRTIGSQAERLKKLTEPQLLLFGVLCIDHALAKKLPDFSQGVSPEHLLVTRTALGLLWDCARGKPDQRRLAHSLNELLSLLPQDDCDDFGPLGWIQITEALVQIIEAVGNEQRFKAIFGVADAAYEAISQSELQRAIRQSGRVTFSGEEIPLAEAASPLCQAELNFQLECLQSLEDGRPITAPRG
jgi:hypothetical protein